MKFPPFLLFLVVISRKQGVHGTKQCGDGQTDATCSFTLDTECGKDGDEDPKKAEDRGCFFCTEKFRYACNTSGNHNNACQGTTNLLVSCDSCIGVQTCENADNSQVWHGACRCAFDSEDPDNGKYGCPLDPAYDEWLPDRESNWGGRAGDTCRDMQNSIAHNNSCIGSVACRYTTWMEIHEDGCQGLAACYKIQTNGPLRNIGIGSCNGTNSCAYADYINILGANSCKGIKDITAADYACYNASYSTIGGDSCRGTKSCFGAQNTTIDYDACIQISSCQNTTNCIIHDRACVGQEACIYADAMDIHEDACLGMSACQNIDNEGTDLSYNGGRLNIGIGSCNGTRSCENAYNFNIVGANSCKGIDDNTAADFACLNASYCTLGGDCCRGTKSCSGAQNVTVGDRACRGDLSCSGAQNVKIGNGACNGDSACEGLSNTVVSSPTSRRGLEGHKEMDEEQDLPRDIPNETCVGPGICKKCKYPLKHFRERCHKDRSPQDVTDGGLCKLCKSLGSDKIDVHLLRKAKEEATSCNTIGRIIVDGIFALLVEQGVPGIDLRLGPIHMKAMKKKGHCRVLMDYHPNTSKDDDDGVLLKLKENVRKVVHSTEIMTRLQVENPQVSKLITSIEVMDDKNLQESGRSGRSKSPKSEKSKVIESSTSNLSSKASKAEMTRKENKKSSFFH